MKRLADAKVNGDNILGVIVGSAVNQSSNASPITVPHSASQVGLYEKVAKLARINPLDVSYCEARKLIFDAKSYLTHYCPEIWSSLEDLSTVLEVKFREIH